MAETMCVSSGVITKPLAAFHTTASPGPNNQLKKPPWIKMKKDLDGDTDFDPNEKQQKSNETQ